MHKGGKIVTPRLPMEHLDAWLAAYQLRDIRETIGAMIAPPPPPFTHLTSEIGLWRHRPYLKSTVYGYKSCARDHRIYWSDQMYFMCIECACIDHSS